MSIKKNWASPQDVRLNFIQTQLFLLSNVCLFCLSRLPIKKLHKILNVFRYSIFLNFTYAKFVDVIIYGCNYNMQHKLANINIFLSDSLGHHNKNATFFEHFENILIFSLLGSTQNHS